MAKIIIVGHTHSNYQTIETLLQNHGMSQAQPSKREGLSPVAVNALLKQAAPPLWPSGNPTATRKKAARHQIGSVWNALVMDLFLANINTPLWGWADPQAIGMLEYWRDADPTVHFILVYDQPHSILTHTPQQELNAHILAQKLQEWTAYNESLLDFYTANPGRCLLVHSAQAQRNTKKYLKQISRHIDAPWQIRKNKNGKRQISVSETSSTALTTPPRYESPKNLACFLANLLIPADGAAAQLYEQLQQHADLPLKTEAHRSTAIPGHALAAWQAMQEQLYRQSQLIADSLSHKNHLETLNGQLRQTEAELESARSAHKQAEERLKETQNLADGYRQQNEAAQRTQAEWEQTQAALKKTADAAQKDLAGLKNNQAALQEENTLLLEQLHLVQEKLEEIHLEKQRLAARPVYYGAVERVKNGLPYQLGATMISHSKSVGGCLSMPFALMKAAKLAARREKEQSQTMPPVQFYQDAAELDRVYHHLSYHLGQRFLTCARNPLKWVVIPFALADTAIRFKKQKQKAV